MGLPRSFEREDAVHDRLEPAHEDELHDLLELPAVRHRRPEDRELPPVEVAGVELEDRTGRRARHDDAASPPQGPHGILERRDPDVIDDHVHAALSGQLPDGLGPRHLFVVHQDVGAESLRSLELVVARTRREDVASGELRDLNRRGGKARPGPEDEHIFSGADPSAPRMWGKFSFSVGIPVRTKRSRWFNAAAWVRTRTWSGPITGSGKSVTNSRTSGPPYCGRTTAFSVPPMRQRRTERT